MMSPLLTLLALLSLTCLVTSLPLDDLTKAEDDLEARYHEHVGRLKEHPCSKPQVVVLDSSQLFSNFSSALVVHPRQTVQMRCLGTSGCCRDRHVCVSSQTSRQTLVFRVWDVVARSVSYVSRELEQDLHCECVKTAALTMGPT